MNQSQPIQGSLRALLAGGLTLFALAGAQVPDMFKVLPGGALQVGDLVLAVQVYDGGWSSTPQSAGSLKPTQGFPKTTQGRFETRGVFQHGKVGAFNFSQVLETMGAQAIRGMWNLSRAEAVKLNTVALVATLQMPSFAGKKLIVDGKEVALPATYVKGNARVFSGEAQEIIIPIPSGKLKVAGLKSLLIQDYREWGGQDITVRLYFDPYEGMVSETSLVLEMEASGLDTQTLPLAAAANMAFADGEADDGKGGWTDQGRENDLGVLKGPSLKAAGIQFDLLPLGGPQAVVLSGPQRKGLPQKASAPLGGQVGSYLYLLHATAWTPSRGTLVGEVVLEAQDGSTTRLPVAAGIEVGDWWNPNDTTNGAVAWAGTNAKASVGLYISRFAIPPKALRRVTFEASGKAVWMVVAATVSPDRADLHTIQVPLIIGAGPDWAPIDVPRAVLPGSVLDFSFVATNTGVPAGKFGHLKVMGPHFEFAGRPGVRARFSGGNICFTANFLERDEADAFADRLVRLGHNSVRIHHHEARMMDMKKPGPGAARVMPEMLEKLDYQVAAMKKRGIYITTDLFVSRRVAEGDIPGFKVADMYAYKSLVYLGPALEDFKAFAKWFFVDHVNPHTGLPLGKDPALLCLSLVNEGNLPSVVGKNPETEALARKLFEEELSRRGETGLTGNAWQVKYTAFLVDRQVAVVRELKAWLKGLGVVAPVTDGNYIDNPNYMPLRQELDYVDVHAYWDHPSFPEDRWRMPYRFTLRQPVAALGSMPTVQAGSRVLGKPFTVSEYQYCFPNPYRAEGSLIMAAVAGLQDWDALWRFALSGDRNNIIKDAPVSGFDILVDPVNLLGEQLATLVFLRGDVRAATGMVPLVADERLERGEDGISGEGWSSFPKGYHQWALHTRIGTHMTTAGPLPKGKTLAVLTPQAQAPEVGGATVRRATDDLFAAMKAEGSLPPGFDPEAGRVQSETGEFRMDSGERTFAVSTPRFESVVLPEGKAVTARILSAKSLGEYGILAAVSLDGEEIAKSKRTLILHLTEILNNQMRFRTKQKTLVEDWGSGTRLVAKGRAEVTLALSDPAKVKVWGCDLSGKRVEEIPLTRSATGITFLAETVRGGKARFKVYEVTRE